MELAFGNDMRITIFVVNYDTVLRQAPTPVLNWGASGGEGLEDWRGGFLARGMGGEYLNTGENHNIGYFSSPAANTVPYSVGMSKRFACAR